MVAMAGARAPMIDRNRAQRMLREVQREICRRSLHEFIRRAWKWIDPAPFKDGQHIEAICQFVHEMIRGEFQDGVICLPPRHMKSLLISVALPAWIWTFMPQMKFMGTSYDQSLATRDSVKMRRLVESPWYQDLWGDKTKLVKDQNEKLYYESTAGGLRMVSSPSSRLTGHGADLIWCDDPHNVVKGESELDREKTVTWWREGVSSRLNDQLTGMRLIIQQRVHEKDLAGEMIREGYRHIVLPAEFEEDHPQRSHYDWRTTNGELLWPERFTKAALDKLGNSLGAYARAGQLQMRPVPREGGIFQRQDFEIIDALPANISVRSRGWDFAGTEQAGNTTDPDWTAGVKMSVTTDGIYIIEDVVRARAKQSGVEALLKLTAKLDGSNVKISIPQDPGQAGKGQAAWFVKVLSGFTVSASTESGSKVVRAGPLASQSQVGNVKLLKGEWNEKFLEEICMFPGGAHDDQVDAAARAFMALLTTATGMLDHLRRQAEEKAKQKAEPAQPNHEVTRFTQT